MHPSLLFLEEVLVELLGQLEHGQLQHNNESAPVSVYMCVGVWV